MKLVMFYDNISLSWCEIIVYANSMGKQKNRFSIIDSQVLRYFIIGVCTTLVNYVSFLIMCYMTPMGDSNAGVTAANIISIIASIIFAFFSNKYIVFNSETSGLKEMFYEMMRFVGARTITMAIEVIGVFLIILLVDSEPFIGKLLVQGLVVVVNYYITRHLVFRKLK